MPDFFENRRLRYEIQLLAEKRWQIADLVGDGREESGRPFGRGEFEALERAVLDKAAALLAGGGAGVAVRVMRDRIRADGFTTSSEIFYKEAGTGRTEPPLAVGRYDGEVPLCAAAADLYRREACRTIGVVLRGFLDRHVVTAVELLHFYPYIRTLNDQSMLVQGAIHQLDTLQVKTGRVDARSRAAALHGFVAALEAPAREAMAEKRLPAIAEGGFHRFAERIAARYDGARRHFFTMVGLARHFQGTQSALGKLDFVLAAVVDEGSDEARATLDEFAAGCLDGSRVVMDLLGYQANLAAALTALGDLAAGRGAAGAADGILARLGALIAAGRLPLAAEALWERILRELGRGSPLSRRDETREWPLLMALDERLLGQCPAACRSAIDAALKIRLRRLREAAEPCA